MITSIQSPSPNARRSIVPAPTNTRQLAQILFSSDNLSLDPRFSDPEAISPNLVLHLAPLVPQAPDRVCEKLVIVHESASGSRAVSNSPRNDHLLQLAISSSGS